MRIGRAIERALAICWLFYVAWWLTDGLRQLSLDTEYLRVFLLTSVLLSVIVSGIVFLWRQSRWRYALLLPVALASLGGMTIFLSNSQGFPLADLVFGWFAFSLSVLSIGVALFGFARSPS